MGKTFTKAKKKENAPFSNIIEDHGGILTGSRAFGVGTNKSDYDYIVRDIAAVALYKIAEKYMSAQIDPNSVAVKQIGNGEVGEFEYGGLGSFYVSISSDDDECKEVYNIVSLNTEDFLIWRDVTEMMKHAPRKLLYNRDVRRYVFHNTVDIMKMLL